MAENFQNTLIAFSITERYFLNIPSPPRAASWIADPKTKRLRKKKQPASATEIEHRRAENAAAG